MTVLYINGQLCDLPTDFKITLVTENLYFSKASTYTYDIELPITPYGNNAKIFVGYNRADKRLANQALPARLIVDNRVVLNGSAIVVGTTEHSVSVQLLQGNSELNWKQRLEATYIDELDLGNVSEWGLRKMQYDDKTIIVPLDILATVRLEPNGQRVFDPNILAASTNGNVVYTPIYNAETAQKMNGIKAYNNIVFLSVATVLHPSSDTILYPDKLAPQPKFNLMLVKVFSAAGYTIIRNDLTNSAIYNNLYIANSTSVWQQADMLPHLTVPQFIEQIEALFNCVVVLDDNTAKIINKKDFYSNANADIQDIENVIDDFSVQVDSETDVSDNDKARTYDISYEDFGTYFLGHEFDGVSIVDITKLSATPDPNVFAIDNTGHKVSSPYIDNGEIKGFKVDHFEPSFSISKNEFSLKLVPVSDWEHISDTRYDVNSDKYRFYYFRPTSPGKYVEEDDTTIQQLLDDHDTPREKEYTEKMGLGFLASSATTFNGNIGQYSMKFLSPIILAQVSVNTPQEAQDYVNLTIDVAAQQYDLSLIDLKDDNNQQIKNLFEAFYSDNNEIVTSISYALRFVPNGKIIDCLPPIRIKSQLFACKQIKYTISPRGFEKIAEGDFYKLW